jgi:hypothetical protein
MNQQSEGDEPKRDSITIGKLAFIYLCELEKDHYRGGILITDDQGKPLEFRCTSPIQPTAVQKTLYGGTLQAHMAIELSAKPLLKAAMEKPDTILVAQEEFSELRKSEDTPMLIVSKQGATLAQNETDKPATSELLASQSGKFEPIVVVSHWAYPGDLETTRLNLAGLFSKFDLTEPFERIRNALRLVHEKEKGTATKS